MSKPIYEFNIEEKFIERRVPKNDPRSCGEIRDISNQTDWYTSAPGIHKRQWKIAGVHITMFKGQKDIHFSSVDSADVEYTLKSECTYSRIYTIFQFKQQCIVIQKTVRTEIVMYTQAIYTNFLIGLVFS